MKELTVDLAYRELQQILQDKVLLVVGTGASMALDPRFGMGELSKRLQKEIPGYITDNNDEEHEWKKAVKILEEENNLEKALKNIRNKSLIEKIVRVTGIFLTELDKEFKLKILNNGIEVPIGSFIQKLVNGLPEYDPVLDIITPNYDLLIEHCCDKMRIPYITGFWGGIKKYYNWDETIEQMGYIKSIPKGRKILKVERKKKHIRLHKVHGSLNWFKNKKGIFEDNTLVYENYEGRLKIERLIITPGDSKYEKAFLDHFERFRRADEAISGAGVFVFVGYGFNDDHIQRKIKNELIENKREGVIITRGLSKNAEELLNESEKLWAVYQSSQNDGNGNENDTFIYNKAYNKPLTIKESCIWDIQKFSREVLGE